MTERRKGDVLRPMLAQLQMLVWCRVFEPIQAARIAVQTVPAYKLDTLTFLKCAACAPAAACVPSIHAHDRAVIATARRCQRGCISSCQHRTLWHVVMLAHTLCSALADVRGDATATVLLEQGQAQENVALLPVR